MRRILLKLFVCTTAFTAGIAWGVVAEATENGASLAQIFGA